MPTFFRSDFIQFQFPFLSFCVQAADSRGPAPAGPPCPCRWVALGTHSRRTQTDTRQHGPLGWLPAWALSLVPRCASGVSVPLVSPLLWWRGGNGVSRGGVAFSRPRAGECWSCDSDPRPHSRPLCLCRLPDHRWSWSRAPPSRPALPPRCVTHGCPECACRGRGTWSVFKIRTVRTRVGAA